MSNKFKHESSVQTKSSGKFFILKEIWDNFNIDLTPRQIQKKIRHCAAYTNLMFYILKRKLNDIDESFSIPFYNFDAYESACKPEELLRNYPSIRDVFFVKTESGYYYSSLNYKKAIYQFSEIGKNIVTNILSGNYEFITIDRALYSRLGTLKMMYRSYNIFEFDGMFAEVSVSRKPSIEDFIPSRTRGKYLKSIGYSWNTLPEYHIAVSKFKKNDFEPNVKCIETKHEIHESFYDIVSKEEYHKIVNNIEEIDSETLKHSTIIDVNTAKRLIDDDTVSESDKLKLKKLIKKTKGDNSVTLSYTRSVNSPRMYERNTGIQTISKEVRNEILSSYTPIDISSSIFSVMYNYALQRKYTGSLTYLSRAALDSKNVRSSLLSNMHETDPDCTMQYIKTNMIALAYGANMNTGYVDADSIFGCFNSVPCITSGYSKRETPTRFTEHEFIRGIKTELKQLVKWIVSKDTVYINGKRLLKNDAGETLELVPRMGFGKKLVHIYQSLEVKLLRVMMNKNFSTHKPKEKIGLLLHDGMYVSKEIVSDKFISDMEQHITDTMGFRVSLHAD